MSKKGRDEWKYKKIYEKKGILSKGGRENQITGDWDEYKKAGKQGKWEKYGRSNEGRDHISSVSALRPRSVLDVGCGWNDWCKKFRIFATSSGIPNIECVGADIACRGADVIAPAHDMPMFKNKQFDLVVSFDCMEHIPEEEVEPAFREFNRIANGVFLQICLEHSATRIDASPLHVCIQPEEWWLNIAKRYFILQKTWVAGQGRFNSQGERTTQGRSRSLIIVGSSKDESEFV